MDTPYAVYAVGVAQRFVTVVGDVDVPEFVFKEAVVTAAKLARHEIRSKIGLLRLHPRGGVVEVGACVRREHTNDIGVARGVSAGIG